MMNRLRWRNVIDMVLKSRLGCVPDKMSKGEKWRTIKRMVAEFCEDAWRRTADDRAAHGANIKRKQQEGTREADDLWQMVCCTSGKHLGTS